MKKFNELFQEGVEPNNGYRMNTMGSGFDGANAVYISTLGGDKLHFGMYSSSKPFPKDPNIENVIKQLETLRFSKDMKVAQKAEFQKENLKNQVAKIVQEALKTADIKIEKEVKDLFKKASENILKK